MGKTIINGEGYRAPVEQKELADWEFRLGTRFQIGGGLDRALPYSKHGDSTFWTVVGKGKTHGEEFVVVLNQVLIEDSSDRLIKEAIWNDHKRYRLDNVALEVYQASDIHQWCIEKGIQAEIVHPIDRVQVQSFTHLHQLVEKEQLAIPEGLPSVTERENGRNADLPGLIKEMREFEHEMDGAVPKFGHKPGTKYHDDSVYSLNWAIYALREIEASERKPHLRRDIVRFEGNPYTTVMGQDQEKDAGIEENVPRKDRAINAIWFKCGKCRFYSIPLFEPGKGFFYCEHCGSPDLRIASKED